MDIALCIAQAWNYESFHDFRDDFRRQSSGTRRRGSGKARERVRHEKTRERVRYADQGDEGEYESPARSRVQDAKDVLEE